MSKKILKIDDIDKKIINILQKDPNLSHTEIGKRVNRSQPSVGVRIKKLEEAGIIKFQAGIDLKTSNFYIGWLDIQTKFPEIIFEKVDECPFVINAFKRSGRNNVCVLIACPSFEYLDSVVNHHFRNESKFQIKNFDVVTDVVNNTVLPIDPNFKSCVCITYVK